MNNQLLWVGFGLFAFFSLALSIAVQTPKNAETLQAKSEKSSPLKQRSVIVVGTTGMKRSVNEVSQLQVHVR